MACLVAHSGRAVRSNSAARGRDPLARFVRMTDQLHRERFVAAGVLTEADFDELIRAYDDQTFWFVGFTLFGAWGRRPG